MNALRAGLPPLPPKMRHLPIDKRGFPVPFFVATIHGEPDHRVAEPRALKTCVQQDRCWICGGPLGRFRAFLVGPMCAVTRTVSEPPSHRECATYAAIACPFLARPGMHRREAGLPEARHLPPGDVILRNPGAVGVWLTIKYRIYPQDRGILFDIGEPESTEWYCEGRQATRAEVDASIASGLPLLHEVAAREGAEGLAHLAKSVAKTALLLDGVAALKGTQQQGGAEHEHMH